LNRSQTNTACSSMNQHDITGLHPARTTSAPYDVGAVTNNPAASRKLHPFGTGSIATSLAMVLVAYAPCVAPKTREPTGNLGFLEPDGVARTIPANSAPEIHGNADRLSVKF